MNITGNDRPAAVLMSAEDVEALQETLSWSSQEPVDGSGRTVSVTPCQATEDVGQDSPGTDPRRWTVRRPTPARSSSHLPPGAPSTPSRCRVARAALALTSSDLGADPHRDGTALHPPLENRHSARRGGYRILSRTGYQVITILDVEHRRDVHRR